MLHTKKTIAVMTSGGDAPGMNAAIYGVYKAAKAFDYRVLGICNGFTGLIQEDLFELTDSVTTDIMHLGGTILGTSRCDAFLKPDVQKLAGDICRALQIEAVVVIGGDGSFRGAQMLARQNIGVIGIPATIDLDIGCTDYTIGFDTAVNSAMESIDKIKDTSRAHSCCSVIEVMGRKAGYIALWCGIASNASCILIPEDNKCDTLIEDLRAKDFRSGTIVIAEGAGRASEIAEKIQVGLHIHTRPNVLGFLQRGGSPTCKDRIYGRMMGGYAVELIVQGTLNQIIAMKRDTLRHLDLEEGLKKTKELPKDFHCYL